MLNSLAGRSSKKLSLPDNGLVEDNEFETSCDKTQSLMLIMMIPENTRKQL